MPPEEEVDEEFAARVSSQFASRLARFAFVPPTSGLGSKSSHEPAVRLSPKRITSSEGLTLSPGSSSASARASVPSKSPTKRGISQLTHESSPSSGSKKVKVYDHLHDIPDHLDFGLDIIFCGINPGEQSSRIGHHYANPTNHFWSCLHESGLTSRKLDPRQDSSLPKSFQYGLTNLVNRPTVEQSELSRSEQMAGVAVLLAKIRQYKPLVVCFVGLGIAEIFKSVTMSKQGQKKSAKVSAGVGLQSYKIVHEANLEVGQNVDEDSISGEGTNTTNMRGSGSRETVFFAVSSTSGRVVRYQKQDKVQQFMNLKDLLAQVKTGQLDTDILTNLS